MGLAETLGRNAFPEEPLDSKDRRLIQTLHAEGAAGIGFNRLVDKTKGSVSRSTVAARVKRLERLGYLERKREEGRGRERPVRLTFRCHTLMIGVDKTREVAGRLRSQLGSMRDAPRAGKEEARTWWVEFRERYSAFFGMVGTMAVFYGTSAAGDLFLPMIVEDYRSLSTEFMELARSRPDLLRSLREIIDEKAAAKGVDLEHVMKETREEVLEGAAYRSREWGEAGSE